MESRRETLKIIGAIGSTCAFPFAAVELYGQHEAGNAGPLFFSGEEMSALGVLADLIIPATDTPGAAAAGVPLYIDRVVRANAEYRKPFREGLAWLDAESGRRHGKKFVELSEAQQIAMLEPVSEAAEAKKLDEPGARFFEMAKNMTADGYYTSRAGLVEELGYKGNMAMESFPSCAEH